VSSWLQARGRDARILVLLPGHAGGNLTRFLSRYHKIAAASDGVAASIESSGAAVIVQRYELPQGRRYALLGPPRSPEKL
jgi:hypothetical protein